jgi:hypothetical protein
MLEPLLSGLLCVSPFETLPRGDLGTDERDEPFAKLCEGDRDPFAASSLSRRIVPSRVRLRFELWREDGPGEWSESELPRASSASEKLRRRFLFLGRACSSWAGAAVVVVGVEAACSEVRAAGSGLAMRAENAGEEAEGRGFGAVGWAEAIRGLRFGVVVASARTNAGAGYPQMKRSEDRGSGVPVGGFVVRVKMRPWGHGAVEERSRGGPERVRGS